MLAHGINHIFRGGKIVAYAGSIAHLPDIGGRPQSPDSTDMFEEGIRIPMLKLYKEGQPNTDVFSVIEASVRLPNEVRGDIQSMVASNEVMSREVLRFMDEYGLDDLEGLAEAMAKSAVRTMGTTVGREIIRGVLGSLLGGGKRR